MIYKDCRFCNWCPVHFRGSVDLVQQFFLKVGCLTLYFFYMAPSAGIIFSVQSDRSVSAGLRL